LEHFKIEHFERENAGMSFPAFQPVPAPARDRLRARLAEVLELPTDASGDAVVHAMCERAKRVHGADADNDPACVARVLRETAGELPDQLYISWSWDSIDEMAAADFCKWFDDIWYPSSDDIVVFDASCAWYVLIDHHGVVVAHP
jgi:hypothetical protein